VYTPTKLNDTQRANRIKATIQTAPVFDIAKAKRNHRPYNSYYRNTTRFSLSDWNQKVLGSTGFSPTSIRKHSASVMVDCGGQLWGSVIPYCLLPLTHKLVSLDRIMSAYTDDRKFSIDLVGAVCGCTTYCTNGHSHSVPGYSSGLFYDQDAWSSVDRAVLF
jgi:hypothetical protein